MKKSILFLFAIVFLSTQQAFADLQYEMVDVDDGAKVMVIFGAFGASDDLTSIRVALASPDVSLVMFDSEGGSVGKAMELGRAIRSNRKDTMQLKKGIDCVSACALAFFGGVRRFAEPGSIGVHKSSFGESGGLSSEEAVSQIQSLTAVTINYLVEMGVSPGLMSLSLSYDSDDMRYLSGSEMAKYNVVTPEVGSAESPTPNQEPQVNNPIPRPPNKSNELKLEEQQLALLQVPEVKFGRVRHSKGAVYLKSSPSTKSANLNLFRNGVLIEVLGNDDRWFRVKAAGQVGYMHHTWLWASEYPASEFDYQRYIQIKSFDNLAAARDFVRQSEFKTDAYLASNGWFAITVSGRHELDKAKQLNKLLKSQGHIPNDSFVTLGNTYVRKVCCD